MVCSSCDQPKAELFPRKSALINGMTLYMCKSCIEARLEPRWVVILIARRQGPDSVKDFIKKYKYIGDPITAEEIVI